MGLGWGEASSFTNPQLPKNLNLSKHLSNFHITCFLSYDPRGKSAGEKLPTVHGLQRGAGNQGLAIDIAPYYIQCSICIIYFFIHISLLLIIISKLHLLMTKGLKK